MNETACKQVTATFYLPENTETIKVISITGKNEVVNEQVIKVGNKIRTCQMCGSKFVSTTSLSRYCFGQCKAKASNQRKLIKEANQ